MTDAGRKRIPSEALLNLRRRLDKVPDATARTTPQWPVLGPSLPADLLKKAAPKGDLP